MLELQKFRINLIELASPLCSIRLKETAGASDERAQSSSMTHVGRRLNAQHVWMRWLQKGVCSGGETDEGKHVLLRIASMLTELIERFDISSSSSSSSSIVREEPDEKGFEDEDEGRE